MKINEHSAIITPKVLLVPYCPHHVPTYHEWMQDEEIQQATASEPLTLPEEHSMQQSWRLDPDKLTFIICHSPFPSSTLTPKLEDAPSKMLGDVNLFLSEDEDFPGEEEEYQGSKAVIGEIEIMIAVPTARRKGLALSSLQAFLAYISGNLEAILEEYRVGSDERSERYLRYLRVKIDKDNVGSVGLFTKMGFEKVGCVNYFGEVEMRMGVEGMVGMEGRGEVVEYGS